MYRNICVTVLSLVTLCTAVPHCSHSRAPLFTQPCPGRTMSTAVCIYVAGCVQAVRLCRGHLWLCPLKPKVVTMPNLSSLVAHEFAVMTTYGAASDDTVVIMATLCFQWPQGRVCDSKLTSTRTMLNLSDCKQSRQRIEAVTTWPPFCWRHFQMHFLGWNCLNFD